MITDATDRLDGITPVLTSPQSGGTTRHYRLADNRGCAVQRTNRRGEGHGLIVSMTRNYDGDYRDDLGFRWFSLRKTDDGWFVVETGWGDHIAAPSEADYHSRVSAEGFRTKRDAEHYAVGLVIDGEPLPVRAPECFR